MAAGLLDQLDTAALRQAARETRVHVDLGELGTVDVRVRSAAALDAGRLHVTVEAARADTAALLRGGIGGLCEALEARGYADPTVDVEGPDTRPGGGSEEQAHGESRWEQAEDAEALAAAIGRRVRDRASGAAGARREQA